MIGNLERGNFTDQMERGEYSIDLRDLVPVSAPGLAESAIIYDRQGLIDLLGKDFILDHERSNTYQIGFVIRTEADEAFELLSDEDQARVRAGNVLAIENNGNVRLHQVIEDSRESVLVESVEAEIVPATTRIDAGTFPWIKDGLDVPIESIYVSGKLIRLADLTRTDKKLADLGRRLNGSTPKATALVRTGLGEAIANNGIIRGAMTLRDRRRQVPIFGVQSQEGNPATRVSAFFTLPDSNDMSYIIARTRYADSRVAVARLEGAGYQASTLNAR